MNGPEHFREAERLLVDCQLAAGDDDPPEVYPAFEDGGVNSIGNALAAAQVHATLAQAAAIIDAPSAVPWVMDQWAAATRGGE